MFLHFHRFYARQIGRHAKPDHHPSTRFPPLRSPAPSRKKPKSGGQPHAPGKAPLVRSTEFLPLAHFLGQFDAKLEAIGDISLMSVRQQRESRICTE
jgi:hypothetical protein